MNIRDAINRIDDIRASEEYEALRGEDDELDEEEIERREQDALFDRYEGTLD